MITASVAGGLAAALLIAGCAGAEGSGGQHSRHGAAVSAPPSSAPARSASSAAPTQQARIDLHANHATMLHRIQQSDVPLISYHQIRNWTPDDSSQARPYIMPVATFTAQMNYLATHGYHTITAHRLVAHVSTGAPLPTKPVMLSFDDGEEGQFTTAFPILQKHGFTATFFPMTVVLGKKHWMSPGQLRILDRAGMTIGDHTWDHHRVDRYSSKDWHKQLAGSRATLRKILGHPVHYFAYPYGVWDEAAFPHLTNNGIWAAFQLTSDPVDEKAPLQTLQRQLANPYWSIDEFAKHLHQ
jgi:peptidoglycan/xylan/chitin deacetylase (PgdA/CDA1 family)